MATISFEKDLVIDTKEAVNAVTKAIEEAEKSGPLELPDLSDVIENGEEFLKKGKLQ